MRIVMLVLAVLALTVAAPAVAGKGGTPNGGAHGENGNGNGNGGGGQSDAAVWFSTSQAVVGQQYSVSGSGFGENAWVMVGARFSDTTWWASGYADDHGAFSFTFTASSAGQVVHDAYEMSPSGNFRLESSATLGVVAS